MKPSARLKKCSARLILSFFVISAAPALGCGSSVAAPLDPTRLTTESIVGDLSPVRDPSIILQNGTYYLFSTDSDTSSPFLHIRCSSDKKSWRSCGQVFSVLPQWIKAAVPGVANLWAPDISFFNGLYHLYYAGTLNRTQKSVIGLATNTTLDPADPAYKWVDAGKVLASENTDDFNAIDPNIFVDTDSRVWLQFGSFVSGIKQREIDPATGMLLASNPMRHNLAARPDNAVEGASLVRHGDFYFLFLSVEHCCQDRLADDDYKQAVGRSASPNGPFLDAAGVDLMQGGGTVLLQSDSAWIAPGGGSAYLNPASGDSIIVFHALNASAGAAPYLWLKLLTWKDDWPVLNPL